MNNPTEQRNKTSAMEKIFLGLLNISVGELRVTTQKYPWGYVHIAKGKANIMDVYTDKQIEDMIKQMHESNVHYYETHPEELAESLFDETQVTSYHLSYLHGRIKEIGPRVERREQDKLQTPDPGAW